MSILQATHSYSIIHNFFKTFRTHSQQIKLESWKVENAQLLKSIYANCSPVILNIHLSFKIKIVCHSGMNI